MFRRLPVLFILVCSAMTQTGFAADQKSAQKNVVLFVVDDQGFQAGCFGNGAIKTPGIDRLAAAGTRFTRAHCTTASCSASRSVLMTGLYNHATGHYGHRCDAEWQGESADVSGALC